MSKALRIIKLRICFIVIMESKICTVAMDLKEQLPTFIPKFVKPVLEGLRLWKQWL